LSLLTNINMLEPTDQLKLYPPTRFMGSKRKLLQDIWKAASAFEFQSVADVFSGSGVVSYLFKANGKEVHANDYMAMAATFSRALIENNTATIDNDDFKTLTTTNSTSDRFVQKTFGNLYFSNDDNSLIDTIRTNLKLLDEPKRSIALSALIRACMKKRARGIFTYTGVRYDDGRRDLQLGLLDQFKDAIEVFNSAVFDNRRRNRSYSVNALDFPKTDVDLAYFDPPYYSPLSDNEYVRRYHFVEGLAKDWHGVEIQETTKTKKFKSYPTPFSTRNGAAKAFDRLFANFANSILLVSYSSNSLPTLEEMVSLLQKYKKHVEVVKINHRYSFGNHGHKKDDNKNAVQEYLFIGY
jgi:DNA adenine methylase